MAYAKNTLVLFFLLAAMLMSLAPMVEAAGNNTNGTNGTVTPTGAPPTEPTDSGANTLSSTVALFGAIVAAAVFTI